MAFVTCQDLENRLKDFVPPTSPTSPAVPAEVSINGHAPISITKNEDGSFEVGVYNDTTIGLVQIDGKTGLTVHHPNKAFYLPTDTLGSLLTEMKNQEVSAGVNDPYDLQTSDVDDPENVNSWIHFPTHIVASARRNNVLDGIGYDSVGAIGMPTELFPASAATTSTAPLTQQENYTGSGELMGAQLELTRGLDGTTVVLELTVSRKVDAIHLDGEGNIIKISSYETVKWTSMYNGSLPDDGVLDVSKMSNWKLISKV